MLGTITSKIDMLWMKLKVGKYLLNAPLYEGLNGGLGPQVDTLVGPISKAVKGREKIFGTV